MGVLTLGQWVDLTRSMSAFMLISFRVKFTFKGHLKCIIPFRFCVILTRDVFSKAKSEIHKSVG